jgi:uncharacterized protein (UPF0335 family)
MSNSNQLLLSIVQRIERLEEEKRALSSDIADIKQEAKSKGFEVKIINQMIKERRMTDSEREEQLALAEIYRAALGMLNDTPLGDHARKRFDESTTKPKASAADTKGDGAVTESERAAPTPKYTAPEPKPISAEDIEAARIAGSEAHKDGVSVVKNPHPFGDPRRAAWDEGFCASAGHDGMEVPDAWRRKPKKSDSQDKAA